MKKKYLLLSEVFPPKTGGSGRWFWDLYTRLNSDDVVIVTDKQVDCSVIDDMSGIKTYRINMESASWGVKSIAGILYYIRMIFSLLSILRNYKVDAIHCGRTLPEGVVALSIKLITGIPYYCYVHGEDIEMCRTSREFTWLVNKVIKHASCLICNSENSAALLREWWPVKEDQISVLNPGVDASVFLPMAGAKTKMPFSDKNIILTVSRLQERKGHDVLIKAMPEIIASHPDIIYVIIGSGERFEDLNNLVEELKLGEYVKFLGECSDEHIRQWYSWADLFVLPNRQVGNDVEGFGIVLLEAQASGTAVIAGDSGGTRETMNVGQTGYVVDCRTKEPLVDRITRLFNSRNDLKMMGDQARVWVLENFDWPRIIYKAQGVFDEKIND